MSKDEFNKRLLRKYPTPEKRREIYGTLIDQEEDLLEIYDKKSETEQVVAIHNEIKLVWWQTLPVTYLRTVFLTLLTTLNGVGLGACLGVLGKKNAPKTFSDNFPWLMTQLGVGTGTGLGIYYGVKSGNKITDQMRSTFMKKTGLDKL